MWIARDEDGTLNLFTEFKPHRVDGLWINDSLSDDYYIQLDESLFPEITYHNNPVEVSIIPNKDISKLAETLLNITKQ